VLIVGAILVVVTVDPDGKIRVAGVRRTFDLTSTDFALARFNADGSSDSTFGAAGKVVSRFGPVNGTSIFAERFQPDGKIVAAGIAFANFAPFGSNGDFALARYNADGGVDTAFGSGGRLTTDFNGSEDEARAVAIQSDGKIVAAGSSGAFPEFALARYNPDGSLDSSFGIGGEVTTNVSPIPGNGARAVAIDSGGKILAAGSAFTFAGRDDFALVRYTAAGALDSGFGTGGKIITDFSGGNDRANAIALQPDGRIVARGFAADGPVIDFALARYLGTPQPDTDLALTNVPGALTVDATGRQGAVVTYTSPTVVDEDSPLPSVVCTPPSGSTFAIGTTMVACTVTDSDDANSPVSATFTVHVKGAAEQLSDLHTAVQGVGPGTSLADKAQEAQASLAAGTLADTCGTLGAFIREVQAQAGKKISDAQAVQLVATATRIQAVLGCG
jgi:uncharacterized delta-60 repeat protein